MPEVTRFVAIHRPGATAAVPAGRLTMLEQGEQTLASRFSYGRRYLERANALAVDPVSLPLDARARHEDQAPVNGLTLFGAIRDATPDAWGRRVIENQLKAAPGTLAESVYLDHAGSNRMGALDIWKAPDEPPRPGALPTMMDLEHLLEAAQRIEAGLPVPAHLELLFAGAPSVGGARPKAVLLADGRQWIAKFPAGGDRFNVPMIEHATLELARQSGLDAPPSRLVDLADGRSVLLLERFDRGTEANGFPRRHMISALTALGLHEMESPRAAYADMARAIEQLGVSGHVQRDREELFGRMVFNVLVSNDDDHLRNHAFVNDSAGGGWRLSPLYDVVPRASSSHERFLHLVVGKQGRLATLDNALSDGAQFGLEPSQAASIIDRIARAVRPWRDVFEALHVPGEQIERIASAFRRPSQLGMKAVERQR
jgi:serine/threonine-protein kinase HipA